METGQNSVHVPETALTVCTTCLRGQLHTILKDMDHYPNSCLEELEAFMTLWDVKPRVKECSLEALSADELISQLQQMCEDTEDRASTDIAKISRKRLKLDKHEHGNGRAHKEPGECYQRSISVKHGQH
ncbi:hypothetical protein Tco_0439496 [Tanacetum coccineum]